MNQKISESWGGMASDIYSFRDDVQSLRAIAVISVIFFHMGVPGFQGGFLGVDVFFVISGYLMSSIIKRDLERGSFSFASFYIRRARRILPAVYLTLVFTFFASWFVLFPKNFEDFADVMGASVLFLANAVLMNQSSGYFAVTLENHPLLHMWSLAVEEQFYLIFPLFFVCLLRFGVLWVALVSFLVFVGSLFLAEVYFSVSPSATFFHLPARIFEFFIGVFAFLLVRFTDLPSRLGRACRVVGLLMIIGSVVWFDSTTPFPSAWSLIPLMGTFLILVSSSRGEKWLSLTPAVFIGGISFSLYLAHQPILALLRYQEIDSMPILASSMILAVPLAWVMKVFVEDPGRRRWSDREMMLVLISVGAAMLFLAIAVKYDRGIPSRFNGALMQAVSTAVGSPLRDKCHTDGENYLKPQVACQYFGKNAPKWAVLGDSHGVPVAYALSQKLREGNDSLIHLTFSGCGISKPIASYCSQWLKESVQFLIDTDSVRYVVLSFRLLAELYGRHEFIYPKIPRNKSDEEVIQILIDYRDLVNRLEASGKSVIWIMQPPELGQSMVKLLSSIDDDNADAESVSYSWWVERSGLLPQELKQATSSQTLLIWPENLFCEKKIDTCYAIKDGNSLYRDRDHLSLYGASQVVKYIFRKLNDGD